MKPDKMNAMEHLVDFEHVAKLDADPVVSFSVSINAVAIAETFVNEIMDEDDQLILKFGMLPAEKYKLLEQKLRDKVYTLAWTHLGEDIQQAILAEIYVKGNMVV